MSDRQVVIYSDLSCSYGTALWHLQRDRKRMEEYGVVMAGASPDRYFGWPSHQLLTRRLHYESSLENYYRQILADSITAFGGFSDAKTFLLATSCPWADALAALRQRLRTVGGFKSANFIVLCNMSPQWLLMEQLLRLPRLQSVRNAWLKEWLGSDAMHLGQFLLDLQRKFGRSNVHCMTSEAQSADLGSPGYEQLYQLLDIPPAVPQGSPLTKLCLLSRNTRQILGDLLTLNNVWDKSTLPGVLIKMLQETETKLADAGVLDFRTMLSPVQMREIETLCSRGNAVASAMFPALDLGSKDVETNPGGDWSPWQGNDKNALGVILETIPEDFLCGMHEVLAISHNRLDGDQRELFQALNGKLSGKPLRSVENAAKVTVLVQTYNHEKYIGEALESILAQKTNFGVEIVVVDDASSDGNRKIIGDYAHRYANIRPVFLRSRSKFGECNTQLLAHARTPYVAICDGDDYYTDPNKLQIQADFLDSHPACSLCFHPVRVIYEDGSPEHFYPSPEAVEACGGHFTLDRLFGENFIQTNSVMYRWRFGDGLPAWFDPMLLPSDWYWHLLHAEVGEIGFIDKPMSVYRRHAKSVFWRKDKNSSIGHRQRYGMRELRLYEKVLDHFGDKARDTIQMMANGVFSDFTKMYMESGDDSMLQKGLRYFPEFGKSFLKCLGNVN